MPKKNTIGDLRDHLFETLEALRDDEKPMDIARAKAVADVAKTIIDTGKLEVDFMKATGGVSGSGFIPDETAVTPKQLNGRPAPMAEARRDRQACCTPDTTVHASHPTNCSSRTRGTAAIRCRATRIGRACGRRCSGRPGGTTVSDPMNERTNERTNERWTGKR
jgi:hypothetical protein